MFTEVVEDVNAVSWMTESELIVATEANLLLCDTRMIFSIKMTIDQNLMKPFFGIKFDPFDSNRFAAISEEYVKVYDR